MLLTRKPFLFQSLVISMIMILLSKNNDSNNNNVLFVSVTSYIVDYFIVDETIDPNTCSEVVAASDDQDLLPSTRSESLRCGLCQKLFSCSATLRRHEMHVCGKEATLKCQYCSYTSKFRFNLHTHIRKKHL